MSLADSGAAHYPSYSDARAHLKELLDAAAEGRSATIRRGRHMSVVVDAERFRSELARQPSQAEIVAEAGGWSVFIPGLPVAADGSSFDDALDEMIVALREYAVDWQERLRLAPNHADHWRVVQLVVLSDDDQLRSWLVGEP